MAYTVVDNVLYVAGGLDASGAATDKFEKFDGTSWSSLKSLDAATHGFVKFFINFNYRYAYVLSACLVEKTPDHLLLLGGSANPKAKHQYTISTNSWLVSSELDFSVEGAACVMLKIKGMRRNA